MRNYFYLIILTLGLSSLSLQASNTLEDTIAISDGVVAGHVEEIKQDSIIIRPSRWIGAIQNQDLNFHIFNTQSTSFELGEHIIILVKQSNDKNILLEHALSKFSVRRIGAQKIIVNHNTNVDPLTRQFKLSSFFKVVEAIKHESFIIPKQDYQKVLTRKRNQLSFQTQKRPSRGRSIASVETKSKSNSPHSNQISSMWLLLLLGFMGTIIRAVYKKT